MVILPNRSGSGANEQITCEPSIVVVGPNGAGKSRLGYWIEQNQGTTPVHRIAAQRSLVFEDLVHPKPYEQAEHWLHYGIDNLQVTHKIQRWGGRPDRVHSHLLNDYDALLALLFAASRKRDGEYTQNARSTKTYVAVPDSQLETLVRIWSTIMPHRELIVGNDKIQAKAHNGTAYSGIAMSDGERVALYLIGHALCAPPNSLVIVDEPEIHLHRAIQEPLWDEVEAARPDCQFVYISHDLDFAAGRATARKLIVTEYDGKSWKWEFTPTTESLPEHVLLRILGSRKPALFIEGDNRSLDTAIFGALYPGRLVIPRGGCEKVIEATKAIRDLPLLHHLAPGALIDYDYRTDEEIAVLRQHGIYTANVAEIENLLCVPEAIEIVAMHQGHDPAAKLIEVQEFVLTELQKELDSQVMARTAKEVAFQLSRFAGRGSTLPELKAAVTTFTEAVDVQKIHDGNKKLFQEILDRRDYRNALKYYNRKSLATRISPILGINSGGYPGFVIRNLKTATGASLLAAFKPYLPTEL